MNERRPYAPPPDVDEVADDDTFSDLPGDVELNFNERPRDEYAPDSDDEWYDDEDDFEDDDLAFTEDNEVLDV